MSEVERHLERLTKVVERSEDDEATKALAEAVSFLLKRSAVDRAAVGIAREDIAFLQRDLDALKAQVRDLKRSQVVKVADSK